MTGRLVGTQQRLTAKGAAAPALWPILEAGRDSSDPFAPGLAPEPEAPAACRKQEGAT